MHLDLGKISNLNDKSLNLKENISMRSSFSQKHDISNEFKNESSRFKNKLDNPDFFPKKHIIFKNNLRMAPLHNFDEYLMTDIDPKELLVKGEQRGFTRWRNNNDEYVWKDCVILSYDEITQLYLIKILNTNIKKKVEFSEYIF